MIKITIELNETHFSPDTATINNKMTVENYQSISNGENFILERITQNISDSIKEYEKTY